MSTWRVIRAVLLLPFMVILVIPGVLLYQMKGFRAGWRRSFWVPDSS